MRRSARAPRPPHRSTRRWLVATAAVLVVVGGAALAPTVLDATLFDHQRNMRYAMIDLPARVRDELAAMGPDDERSWTSVAERLAGSRLRDRNGAPMHVVVDRQRDIAVFHSRGWCTTWPWYWLKRHPCAGGFALIFHGDAHADVYDFATLSTLTSSGDLEWVLDAPDPRLWTGFDVAKPAASMTVLVRDVDGQWIADAIVAWRQSGEDAWIGPYRGRDGRYELPGLPTAGVDLRVEAPGREPRTFTRLRRRGGDGALDVILE